VGGDRKGETHPLLEFPDSITPYTLDRFFKLARRSRIGITSHDARMTPTSADTRFPFDIRPFPAGRLVYLIAALPVVLALLEVWFTTATCADGMGIGGGGGGIVRSTVADTWPLVLQLALATWV
jgi:hypothetical protein